MLLEGGHRRRRSSTSVRASRGKPVVGAGASGGVDSTGALAKVPHSSDGQNESPDYEMDELSGAMSALQFVPMSVRFGRRGGKAGFPKP